MGGGVFEIKKSNFKRSQLNTAAYIPILCLFEFVCWAMCLSRQNVLVYSLINSKNMFSFSLRLKGPRATFITSLP